MPTDELRKEIKAAEKKPIKFNYMCGKSNKKKEIDVEAIIYEKVYDTVRNLHDIDTDITYDSDFNSDLCYDSLDFVELVMELENEFKVTIETDEVVKLRTYGQLVDKFKEKVDNKV